MLRIVAESVGKVLVHPLGQAWIPAGEPPQSQRLRPPPDPLRRKMNGVTNDLRLADIAVRRGFLDDSQVSRVGVDHRPLEWHMRIVSYAAAVVASRTRFRRRRQLSSALNLSVRRLDERFGQGLGLGELCLVTARGVDQRGARQAL